MDLILFLVIFPIATIIFSVALQKILNNPFLVSAIVLAIFLIVTYVGYGVNYLIIAVIYSILALIVAYIISLVDRLPNRDFQFELDNDGCCNQDNGNYSCQRQYRRYLRNH